MMRPALAANRTSAWANPFRASVLVFVLAATLFAGCSSSPATAGDVADPIVVRAPDDYAYLNQADAMSRPHVHDYWGGRDRITILDQTQQAVAHYFGGSHWMTFLVFRPDDGQVVPQGTAFLEISVELEPMPGDHYSEAGFRFHGADTTEMSDSRPFVDGRATIESNATRNDLPHQGVSGWEFYFAARSADYVRYTGTVRMVVEAVRGLPIPLFPGHPDQWNGASEIPLFDLDDELYDVYTDVPQPMCVPIEPLERGPYYCIHEVGPDEGRLVPHNAALVEVTMQQHEPGLGLELWFHGSDTLELSRVNPSEASGSMTVYRIPVDGNGDSPYAVSSVWRFMVRGSDSVPGRILEAGSYHLSARVLREAQPIPASRTMSDHDTPSALTSEVPGCLESQGGVRPTDERGLVVTPMSQFSLEVRGPAKDVRLVIALCSGTSLGATLDVPRGCRGGGTMSVHVIGFSSGQKVAEVRCPELPEGEHGFLIESGAATFTGEARLYGATFG